MKLKLKHNWNITRYAKHTKLYTQTTILTCKFLLEYILVDSLQQWSVARIWPISEQLKPLCKTSPDSEAFQFVKGYLQTSSCYLQDTCLNRGCQISYHDYIIYSPLKNSLFNLVHLQIWLCHRNTMKLLEFIQALYCYKQQIIQLDIPSIYK